MKIALLQANPTIGDLAGNVRLIRAGAEEAARAGADLLVTSELMVSGYPPKDLILRQGFAAACDRAVDELARTIPAGLGLLVGHPTLRGAENDRVANGASLLHGGAVLQTIHKRMLPNYDVFDERRYFRPSEKSTPMTFKGRVLGVHICEDGWWYSPDVPYATDPCPIPDPVRQLAEAGAEILINLSASPFEKGKPRFRRHLMAGHARRYNLPFVFTNQVGGNDDVVYDGNSFVLNGDGECIGQLPGFRTGLLQVDLGQPPAPLPTIEHDRLSDLLEALVMGLGDYMRKSGFTDAVLGLSGGVDSALVAYIAAQALGKDHVHGIMLPSRYSSDHSVNDAIQLAEAIGMDNVKIPFDAAHRAFETLAVVGEELSSQPAGLPSQNLQARIRGAIVMARSNHHNWMALATGNKSELAMGYCTLYGDMNGGYAVLADVYKGEVYELCRYINDVRERREVIPRNVIEKAPSAELAPNQFDQDTLPPYPILDGILKGLVDHEESIATLSQTYPRETVEWVAKRLDQNEYKRWQMPPGVKVSQRAYGTGRRMPMAARTTGAWPYEEQSQ